VIDTQWAPLSLEVRGLQVDAAQAAVAMEPVADVAVITGPPSSGKTLMLAARARQLACAHPDWTVAVVVFNRALVPHLTRLIDQPSVTVATVGRFTHQHGHRIDFAGGPAAAAVLAQQREHGITTNRGRASGG
jgi:superfamily II DNA or RNA helicase